MSTSNQGQQTSVWNSGDVIPSETSLEITTTWEILGPLSEKQYGSNLQKLRKIYDVMIHAEDAEFDKHRQIKELRKRQKGTRAAKWQEMCRRVRPECADLSVLEAIRKLKSEWRKQEDEWLVEVTDLKAKLEGKSDACVEETHKAAVES